MSSLTPDGSTSAWRALRASILGEGRPCYHCGGTADCVDHLIPRAHGGTDALENLVPSCTPCNLKRSDGGPNALPSRAW